MFEQLSGAHLCAPVVVVKMCRFNPSRSVRQEAKSLALMTVALLCTSITAIAAPKIDSDSGRARYSAEEAHRLRFTPLQLTGGSKLTLISPVRWSDVADDLVETLHHTHAEYTKLFSSIPAFSTSIRLMDEGSFYELTGAPSWTNAMFIRGQIVIPLSTDQPVDLETLHRSVKHEYTHAIIAALSGGKAPGWIDEGLAQLTEGDEHPALRTSLRNWLRVNDPVPLALLQGGFTKLNPPMVPPAYAQSLLASKAVVELYGYEKLARYFENLREGVSKDAAFLSAFGISTEDFEQKLGGALRAWAKREEP